MTEAEWLACKAPELMLNSVRETGSSRKFRLFICGCCRHLPDAYLSDEEFESIEYAEKYADGEVTLDCLNRYRSNRPRQFHTNGLNWYTSAIKRLTLCRRKMLFPSALQQASMTAGLRVDAVYGDYRNEHREARRAAKLAELQLVAGIARDIFGNPFRPVAFDAAWRTSTAAALAKQMYESRDFGAMPILADALQDAGCTSDDILDHCRDPKQTHVRGCWVVDLVLGKE